MCAGVQKISARDSRKVPRNGEKNTTFGVYRSLCCGLEIVISQGSLFPDCPNHLNLPTEWKSVSEPLAEIPNASDLAKKKKNNPAA
jgi:hypothetical protein